MHVDRWQGRVQRLLPWMQQGWKIREENGVGGFLQVKWTWVRHSFPGHPLLWLWLWRSKAIGSACFLPQVSVVGTALEMDLPKLSSNVA